MAKELHLNIYGIIGDELTAKSVSEKLQSAADAQEIVLHINSFGGYVYEGYTIYNLLRNSGKKITAKVEGVCASIATLIALAAEEIEMFPLAQWLIHNPTSGVEGDKNDMLRAYNELDRIENTLAELYVTKTGKTAEEIKALMNEDKFVSAEEALEMGFITAVSEPLKAVAYLKTLPVNNKKANEMTEEIQNSLADKIVNGLKGLFTKNEAPTGGEKTTPVNASVTLADGSQLYFDGELAEGVKVFVDAEMQTPAENGTYELEDGRSITITDGAITAIVDAPDETAQALADKDAEIANLKAEVESLKGAKAKATDLETKITNLQKEFEKVKAFVPGGGDNSPKPKQTYSNYDQKKEGGDAFNKVANNIKNKLKK